MKPFWKYSWIVVTGAITIALVACNKNDNNGGGTIVCAQGTTPNGAGGCVATTAGLQPGQKLGFFTQTSNMSQQYNPAGSTMNLGSGFSTLLKNAMGVCDRERQTGGYNSGLAGCNAWLRGFHDIVIQFDGSAANQAKLVVRSAPYRNAYSWYSASLPSFKEFIGSLFGVYIGNYSAVYDPLVLQTTVWPINNSQGFELRANGPTQSYAWWRLIQLQVPNGKIEDTSLNFTMYIDGGNQQMLPAASGTMVRCQTENCGLQGL